MRWIYLSPHFDDAVLSCGGLIADQSGRGEAVEIWTVCAGYPPPGRLSALALLLHAQWGTGNGRQTVELRRGEDRAAAACLGARAVHFPFPDCIYRRPWLGRPRYPAGVFVPPHPAEGRLPARMAAGLRRRLRPGDRLVLPLALGGHVDHRLTRAAGELLTSAPLYYADVPYLFLHPGSLEAAAASLRSTTHPVPAAGLEAWLEAIRRYSSQLGSLMESVETLEQSIRNRWQADGGVPLWQG